MQNKQVAVQGADVMAKLLALRAQAQVAEANSKSLDKKVMML